MWRDVPASPSRTIRRSAARSCSTEWTIALLYTQFPPPLTAGAFATEITLIVCPADISITKTADALSKVGDPVTYTFGSATSATSR